MTSSHLWLIESECALVIALLRKARVSIDTLEGPDDDADELDNLLRAFDHATSDNTESPLVKLHPLLLTIKSPRIDAPTTAQALSAVHAIICQDVIAGEESADCAFRISDAVTRARFTSTHEREMQTDEIVLANIVRVLSALLRGSLGKLLSNESVCEVFQATFRLCFETKLSQILREEARVALTDMVRVLFNGLPNFKEDTNHPYIRKLKARASNRRRRLSHDTTYREPETVNDHHETNELNEHESQTPLNSPNTIKQHFNESVHIDIDDSEAELHAVSNDVQNCAGNDELPLPVADDKSYDKDENHEPPVDPHHRDSPPLESPKENIPQSVPENEEQEHKPPIQNEPTTSPTPPPHIDIEKEKDEKEVDRSPYGLPCVREVFRFIISLSSSLDTSNSEVMQELGLHLIAVALETSAEHLPNYTLMMPLVQNQLCRSLLAQLSLSDNRSNSLILAASLRVLHVLVRNLRQHIKLQLGMFIQRLLKLIGDGGRDAALLSLAAIERLWRLPGVVRELYINYDCDVDSPDLLEDSVKVLSANAFPVTKLSQAHVLCMNALTTALSSIYDNVVYQRNQGEGDGPTRQHLTQLKLQKSVVVNACDIFSTVKPEKGLSMLQENGLLPTPAPPAEVAQFLRNNLRLDKKKIADYICSRKHAEVLAAFVRSFDFTNVRIDEALRNFLESFRLPGEAPAISMIMTHFAEHWHLSNGEPFANADAAFTLAYAIIMLNTDQHNPQVRRNQPPMTIACFKRNVSGCNGGQDFESALLERIYNNIKAEEIVMPAEQQGVVKDNYEWKLLVKRQSHQRYHICAKGAALLDHDVFARVWGPTIAALAFIFDKSRQQAVLNRAVSGFSQCATVAATYGMSHVLDNLVITLCKFTHLTNPASDPSAIESSFRDAHRERGGGATNQTLEPWAIRCCTLSSDSKAQLALKTLADLVHAHAATIQDGWKNILDCLLSLFHARLLDDRFTKVEDYLKPQVNIEPPTPARHSLGTENSSGLLSSLVFYLGGSSGDSRSPRQPDESELALIKAARDCVQECEFWCVVSDSKYMPLLSLQHLVHAVIHQSSVLHTFAVSPDWRAYSFVFFLELLISIALDNRDRLLAFWTPIQEHVCSLLLLVNDIEQQSASLLHERSVVGVLRVASRHMYCADAVNALLTAVYMVAGCVPDVETERTTWRALSYGIHELTNVNAANIHAPVHWRMLTRLLAAAGARHPLPSVIRKQCLVNVQQSIQQPPPLSANDRTRSVENFIENNAERTVEGSPLQRNFTSEPDLATPQPIPMSGDDDWIHVSSPTPPDNPATPETHQQCIDDPATFHVDSSAFLLTNWERKCIDARSFVRCVDTLSFVMRDSAHVTPNNMKACVDCLRAFTHAALQYSEPISPIKQTQHQQSRKSRQRSQPPPQQDTEETVFSCGEEEDAAKDALDQAPHRLLDLCYALHVSAARIVGEYDGATLKEPDKPSNLLMPDEIALSKEQLWSACHKPLLQCMAALCTDRRRHVRQWALTTLSRALLAQTHVTFAAEEWEECMATVLLPLLLRLAAPELAARDPLGIEESRVRAISMACKQVLNHIQQLSTSTKFLSLWLCLLQFMKTFISPQTGSSEMLREAVPESLKNMLLVAHSIRLFEHVPGLYAKTKECVDSFMPGLVDELVPFMEGTTNPGTTQTQKPPPDLAKVAVTPSPRPSAQPTSQQQPLMQPANTIRQASNPIVTSSQSLLQSSLEARPQEASSILLSRQVPSPVLFPPISAIPAISNDAMMQPTIPSTSEPAAQPTASFTSVAPTLVNASQYAAQQYAQYQAAMMYHHNNQITAEAPSHLQQAYNIMQTPQSTSAQEMNCYPPQITQNQSQNAPR